MYEIFMILFAALAIISIVTYFKRRQKLANDSETKSNTSMVDDACEAHGGDSGSVWQASNAADPNDIKLGTRVMLPPSVIAGNFGITEVFGEVVEISTYVDTEDPEDTWREFGIKPIEGGNTIYVSCEEENNEMWYVHRVVENHLVDQMPISNASFNKKPTKSFEYDGSVWYIEYDCRHYDVNVSETTLPGVNRRAGRPSVDNYMARISDYYEVDGDRTISIEFWDGGRCVTVGEQIDGGVQKV